MNQTFQVFKSYTLIYLRLIPKSSQIYWIYSPALKLVCVLKTFSGCMRSVQFTQVFNRGTRGEIHHINYEYDPLPFNHHISL